MHYRRPEFESHLKDLSRSHPPLSPSSLQIHQTVIQIQTCIKIFCNALKTTHKLLVIFSNNYKEMANNTVN